MKLAEVQDYDHLISATPHEDGGSFKGMLNGLEFHSAASVMAIGGPALELAGLTLESIKSGQCKIEDVFIDMTHVELGRYDIPNGLEVFFQKSPPYRKELSRVKSDYIQELRPQGKT